MLTMLIKMSVLGVYSHWWFCKFSSSKRTQVALSRTQVKAFSLISTFKIFIVDIAWMRPVSATKGCLLIETILLNSLYICVLLLILLLFFLMQSFYFYLGRRKNKLIIEKENHILFFINIRGTYIYIKIFSIFKSW